MWYLGEVQTGGIILGSLLVSMYLGMLVKLHDLQGAKEEGENKRKVGQFIGIYIVQNEEIVLLHQMLC